MTQNCKQIQDIVFNCAIVGNHLYWLGVSPVKEYIRTWIPPAAAGTHRIKHIIFCHSPNSPISATKSS